MQKSNSEPDRAIEQSYEKIRKEAEEGGYHLNPDPKFCKSLVKGLLFNENRYGYLSCPCRLASGSKAEDLDIICPCDYRDADVSDFGACYCALYVSDAVVSGRKDVGSIPERRPTAAQRKAEVSTMATSKPQETKGRIPVWRCRVCGYLCGRAQPPDICPICKVTKERFEKFM